MPGGRKKGEGPGTDGAGDGGGGPEPELSSQDAHGGSDELLLSSHDMDPRTREFLEGLGIGRLYPPQAEGMKAALGGDNLVLAVPTATGKSAVAYAAAARCAFAGRKALYMVPLRALASEKYEELSRLGKYGLRVGLSVGDFDAPDPRLEETDVVVATAEKADSMLRHKVAWLDKLGLIVSDEVHLIDEPDRGPTLEVLLARFMTLTPDAQLVALSATIRNADELADWLGATLVSSTWRPVVLKEGIHMDHEIFFTDNTTREVAARFGRKGALPDLVGDIIDEGGQALVFVNTRKAAEAAAQQLAGPVNSILPPDRRKKLKTLAGKFRKGGGPGAGNRTLPGKGAGEEEVELAPQTGGGIMTGGPPEDGEPSPVRDKLGDCMAAGVAFHHAGLSNTMRTTVERAFKARELAVITATPTLAAGINLPARRVIIRDTTRYDSSRGGPAPIPVMEIKQMAGRAGRPGLDPVGEAVLLASTQDEKDMLLMNYLLNDPEPITSKLGAPPALRTHILSSIAAGFTQSVDALEDFMEGTFFAYHQDVYTLEGRISQVLQFLDEAGFITRDGGELRPTLFGMRTSQLYIDPMSAHAVKTALRDTDPPDEAHTAFGLFQLVGSLPDMNGFFLRRSDVSWTSDLAERHRDELYIQPPEDPQQMDAYLATLKTAAVLMLWVRETPESQMFRKFDIYPGDLRNKVELAQWLMYSIHQLVKLWDHPATDMIESVMRRVNYGVRPELLDLCRLPGIGRVRARALFRSGIRTIDDVADSGSGRLASVEGIGRLIADQMKKAAARRVGRGQAGKGQAGKGQAGKGQAGEEGYGGEDGEEAEGGVPEAEEAFHIPGMEAEAPPAEEPVEPKETAARKGKKKEGPEAGVKRKGKKDDEEGQRTLFDY